VRALFGQRQTLLNKPKRKREEMMMKLSLLFKNISTSCVVFQADREESRSGEKKEIYMFDIL
jgi:hypothetical protein